MKISGNTLMGAVSNVGKPRSVASGKSESPAEGVDKFYDQITLSAENKNHGTLQEVSAKLSHEVRTHNTTGKIAELRDAVQSGTYQMDARDTAARMLLLGAVE